MNHQLWEVISTEREWSWSLIGIVVLLAALIVRAFLLRNVFSSMKVRNKTWYKRTLEQYQKRSLVGWIFFGLFILGIILLWRFEDVFLKRFSFVEWLLILILLFLVSVFSHLKAYARSMVEALQDQVDMSKEL